MSTLPADLWSTRQALLEGKTDVTAEIESAIAVAESSACAHVWVSTSFDKAA